MTLSAWGARRRPDDDLFERTLRGDPAAFSEVYRRYQKRIYGYCLARSLNPDAAADATQEVFMRLLRSAPGSIDNPKPWLFKVARNVVIDATRKRDRKPEDLGIEEDSLAWDQLKAADTADEALARSDAKDVYLALRTLRPRYRTAIIMRDVHEQSAKDMADAFETTPGAVDTLVSRARDAFGAAYASVRDLPSACRASVELIYRSHGTGVTDVEREALQAHLDSCERCKAEARRADNPRHLAALLPFLVPAKRLGYSIFQRAAFAIGSVPDAAVQQAPVVLFQPQTWNVATKIGAGMLAAAICTAPVVGTVMNRNSDDSGWSGNSESSRSSTASQGRDTNGSDSWSSDATHDADSAGPWSDRWYEGQTSSISARSSGDHTEGSSGSAWSSDDHKEGSSDSMDSVRKSSPTSSDAGTWSSGDTSHDGSSSWSDRSDSQMDVGAHSDGDSLGW